MLTTKKDGLWRFMKATRTPSILGLTWVPRLTRKFRGSLRWFVIVCSACLRLLRLGLGFLLFYSSSCSRRGTLAETPP